MRDLRERVGLVHELRELADDPKNSLIAAMTGLELIRSCGMAVSDLLVDGHLLLDGALHAHEADAELVLQQLAHRAHAAVAEVVDVVDVAPGSGAASAGTR